MSPNEHRFDFQGGLHKASIAAEASDLFSHSSSLLEFGWLEITSKFENGTGGSIMTIMSRRRWCTNRK